MDSLNDEIQKYLENCRLVRRLSGHTVDAYENDLEQFSAMLPKGQNITPELIRNCVTRMGDRPQWLAASNEPRDTRNGPRPLAEAATCYAGTVCLCDMIAVPMKGAGEARRVLRTSSSLRAVGRRLL